MDGQLSKIERLVERRSLHLVAVFVGFFVVWTAVLAQAPPPQWVRLPVSFLYTWALISVLFAKWSLRSHR